MKVVIRGARGVGKKQLWRRVQGLEFTPEAHPTPAIRSAHINWSYKVTDEVIDVEVWDVVDKAEKSTEKGAENILGDMAADAATIDVYKGTNVAIFVFDPSRGDSLEYIEKELESVPEHLWVLILANFRDKVGRVFCFLLQHFLPRNSVSYSQGH